MEMSVDKENADIMYNDEYHKYWTKEDNLSCISVTTLIHKFENFDEEFWSCYKTMERLLGQDFSLIKNNLLATKKFDSKYISDFNITEEEFNSEKQAILAEWKEKRDASCIRGTAIHKQFELGHIAGDTKELSMLQLGGSFPSDRSNTIKAGSRGVYSELLLARVSDDKKLRVAGQADLVIIDGFDVYILDYKGLPLDTPILTTKGFKLLRDLTKEDIIFDKDGEQTRILNISEVHHNPCYTIEFDNNESITCDYEHRWLIAFRKGTGNYKEVVMTTLELKSAFEKYQRTKSSYDLPKILNAKPIKTEKTQLPIDPYVFGAWLGDGSSKDGSLTNVNENFWKEVERRGYDIGNNIASENRAEQRTIFNIRGALNKIGVLNNKHVPDQYILASYEQRLDLLRGFMDTDGYYNNKRKRFVMSTTRKWQVEAMVKILSSLGVKPTVVYAKKYCNGKIFDGWDITFTMTENPFLIRNQENIEHPKTDKHSFRVIKNIYSVNMVPTKCLEVESINHTFLVGHSLLPTHNTGKKMDTKAYFDTRTKKKVMMKYPLNNVEDSNFWHYSLQLSTYAWMIQKIDPRFNIKLLMLIHIDHDNNVTNYECNYLKEEVERMLKFYKRQVMHEEFNNSMKKVSWE